MGHYLDLARSVPPTDPAKTKPRPSAPTKAAGELDALAFIAATCCRSPRVWCEADRLHARYRASGGRLTRGAFVASLVADGTVVLSAAGLLVGIGLVDEWPPTDGGSLERRGGRLG